MKTSTSISRFRSGTILHFSFWGPLLKPNSRKKGTLIKKGLLRDLDKDWVLVPEFSCVLP